MYRINARFREVDSEIFNQLERAIQQTDAWRFSTASRIRSARKRAVRLMQRHSEKLRIQLNESMQNQLESERMALQHEMTRSCSEKLETIHLEAKRVLCSVLKELLGSDTRLASQAALHRLALLLTLLSKQQGLSITFNPAQAADVEIKNFCQERTLDFTSHADCPAGDFLINLPSGMIESTLTDDIENLVQHFSSGWNGNSEQHA